MNKELWPEYKIFTSLDEVPLDELPDGYEDGDNSILAHGNIQFELESDLNKRILSARATVQQNSNVIIPYPRLLKYKYFYMNGKDVLVVQRALAVAGLRKWGNFTKYYGRGTEKQVANFQEMKNLKPTGVYDLETHKKLSPYIDLWGAHLMTQTKKLMMAPEPRAIIVTWATFGYNNRHLIHYTQGYRRMYGVKNKISPPNIPVYEDCSSFATWLYWGAKLKDPNGLGYNGQGYTGTLARNGIRTTNPREGDLAFYGVYPYSHVVIYIGNGRCISHGSEIGPLLLNVYYRPVSHFRSYI